MNPDLAVTTGTILVIAGAFLASAVEMVEALTILLGVGVVRGWRSMLVGVGRSNRGIPHPTHPACEVLAS
jgi:hypothetical protein